ncbi:MAG: hypothetical protein WAZ19_09050, partial [Anaerolineae bacterium]
MSNQSQWRKNNLSQITLPSGLEVMIKNNLDVSDLVSQKLIVSAILSQFQAIIENVAKSKEVSLADLPVLREVFEGMAKMVFVDPPIHPIPSDQGVALEELSDTDLQFVYAEVTKLAKR